MNCASRLSTGAVVRNQPQSRGENHKKEEYPHANCASRLSTGRDDRSLNLGFAPRRCLPEYLHAQNLNKSYGFVSSVDA